MSNRFAIVLLRVLPEDSAPLSPSCCLVAVVSKLDHPLALVHVLI